MIIFLRGPENDILNRHRRKKGGFLTATISIQKKKRGSCFIWGRKAGALLSSSKSTVTLLSRGSSSPAKRKEKGGCRARVSRAEKRLRPSTRRTYRRVPFVSRRVRGRKRICVAERPWRRAYCRRPEGKIDEPLLDALQLVSLRKEKGRGRHPEVGRRRFNEWALCRRGKTSSLALKKKSSHIPTNFSGKKSFLRRRRIVRFFSRKKREFLLDAFAERKEKKGSISQKKERRKDLSLSWKKKSSRPTSWPVIRPSPTARKNRRPT